MHQGRERLAGRATFLLLPLLVCRPSSGLLSDRRDGFRSRPYWIGGEGPKGSLPLRQRLASSRKLLVATDHDDDSVSSVSRRDFMTWGSAAVSSATILGLTDWSPSAWAFSDTGTPPQDSSKLSVSSSQSTQEILPFSSVRRYKTVILPENKLRVLLVQDLNAQQASAALSIADAGQFADPVDLPGAAHLMEHMILSSQTTRAVRRNAASVNPFSKQSSRDFEEWLSTDAVEGASNAFTGYDKVCFHFNCGRPDAFGEALVRFAQLFYATTVEQSCRDRNILQREIRRVHSELDFNDASTQAFYLLKRFVNDEHPFARFAAGSLESLELEPRNVGMNVGERLYDFFLSYYLACKAVLVVVGPQDLLTLERKVAPFGLAFSTAPIQAVPEKIYPGGFLRGSRYKQVALYQKRSDEVDRLSFNFALSLDYREGNAGQGASSRATATQVCFVLSQIFGRRGPGSLCAFLVRRGWLPPLPNSIPRLSVPLDVSGFQIVRLDIPLTVDGFINRSAIVAAVYNILNNLCDRSTLSRTLLTQYATVAKLNGFLLAPRPPDAVELAVDAQFYGLPSVSSGEWYRFPDGKTTINALQKMTLQVVEDMLDVENAVIIASVGSEALTKSGLIDERLPPLTSPRWITEPTSGGRFCFDDMFKLASRMEVFLLRTIVDEAEIELPVLNPLIPTTIRPPRQVTPVKSTEMSSALDSNWFVMENDQKSSLLPRRPPEPTSRCVFVLELLSPRPARASIRQAAQAELWKNSLETALSDIAELGSFAGLAYDVSFNKFGLRIAFLGLSQTLPSYARRICRRIASHHMNLLSGSEFFPKEMIQKATKEARSLQGVSVLRRRRYISSLRRTTAYEAAAEGVNFLRSCNGAVCFSEGDFLPQECSDLLQDLKAIFSAEGDVSYVINTSKIPAVSDMLYRPQWKPRAASPCGVPGVILINDACGRVPR